MAEIAERSFLDLWSYPNVYRDQGKSTVGGGSELCDLLVVCGDHVVLFSDKAVAFKDTGNVAVDWTRWYRRAVKKSADQLIGAERWLDSPDRLYLDVKCTIPFPLALPPRPRRRTHLVVTAIGAGEACRHYFGGGTGSLMLIPHLSAEASLDPATTIPFAVGDIHPDKAFIHVLDDATLDIMLGELDTITDFVNYLQKKEEFIRAGRLLSAAGEEDLLGYYVKRTNAAGEHDFTSPSDSEWQPGEHIALEEGSWEATQQSPQYLAKKEADQVSYIWDSLISAFTTHMLAGTTMRTGDDFRPLPPEEPFNINNHELGVRYMALEPRFRRRMLGSHLYDAIENAKPDRMQARIVAAEHRPEDTAYVFLQFPRELSERFRDYDLYRRIRATYLYGYCTVIKARQRFHRVIGIATEPPKFYKGRNTSEDLLLLEGECAPDLVEEAERLSRELEILKPQTTKFGRFSAREYPDDSEADGK